MLEEPPVCDELDPDMPPLDEPLVEPLDEPPVVGRLLDEPLPVLPKLPPVLPKPPLDEPPPNPPPPEVEPPPPVPWARADEALRAAANATPVKERASLRNDNR